MRYFDKLLGKIVAWRGYRVIPIRPDAAPMRIWSRVLGRSVEVSIGPFFGDDVDMSIMLSPAEAVGLSKSIHDTARGVFSK